MPLPAAYYNCNEESSSAGLYNSADIDHNHFAVGGTSDSADGKCQLGREISASGYFNAPDSTVFNPGSASPLYLSIWFNAGSIPADTSAILINKDREYQLLQNSDGTLTFRIATDWPGNWNVEVSDSSTLEIGEWQHALFYVLPGVAMGLVVNGGTPNVNVLGSGKGINQQSSYIYIGGPYFVGSSEGGQDWMPGFVGTIDEIAVFNEELTEDQRAMLFNDGDGLFYRDANWGACPGSFRSMNRAAGAVRSLVVPSPDSLANQWLSAGSLDADIVSQYVWGARAGHRDELILRDSTSGSESSVDFLDERLWCLMDYYDPTSIVGNSGAVVERYRFSAFGLRSIMAPDFSLRITSDYAWDFAFKGQFLDLDTGYYNYGYRYYSPDLGRWLSRDPIGERGGYNLYQLASNDPVNQLDYLGLEDAKIKRAECVCSQKDLNKAGYAAATKAIKLSDQDFANLPGDAYNPGSTGREYGGRICCNQKTKIVQALEPEISTTGTNGTGWDIKSLLGNQKLYIGANIDLASTKACSTLGADFVEAGYYHSHPLARALPSSSDVGAMVVWQKGLPSFIGGIDGVTRTDPGVQTVITKYGSVTINVGLVYALSEDGILGNQIAIVKQGTL